MIKFKYIKIKIRFQYIKIIIKFKYLPKNRNNKNIFNNIYLAKLFVISQTNIKKN